MDKAGFIRVMGLRPSGDKGWYVTTCVFCGKRDRLGVIFEQSGDKKPHWHCFKCGRSGNLLYLAKHIGRPDLVDNNEPEVDMTLDVSLTKSIDLYTPVCPLPIGFRRLKFHEYLSGRGIDDVQMEMYKFGMTRLDKKLKNEYIITIIDEFNTCVGYIGRSIRSKEWIDDYNDKNEIEYLRYVNSSSDFEKLLLGIDEITSETHTVICVEGMYDKLATDRKLGLYNKPDVKCVCTFGTKLSDIQALKMAMRGVKNVIIMYDDNTVDVSKKCSRIASSYFRSVRIAVLVGGDPDEVSDTEINRAILSSKSVMEFAITEIDINKYKL